MKNTVIHTCSCCYVSSFFSALDCKAFGLQVESPQYTRRKKIKMPYSLQVAWDNKLPAYHRDKATFQFKTHNLDYEAYHVLAKKKFSIISVILNWSSGLTGWFAFVCQYILCLFICPIVCLNVPKLFVKTKISYYDAFNLKPVGVSNFDLWSVPSLILS